MSEKKCIKGNDTETKCKIYNIWELRNSRKKSSSKSESIVGKRIKKGNVSKKWEIKKLYEGDDFKFGA